MESYIYIYIYIYDLELNLIYSHWFLHSIIYLPQKLKKLDGHMAQNWTPIEIQFRI